MTENRKHNELFNFLKSRTLPYIKASIKDNDTAEELFQTSFIKLYTSYGLDLSKKSSLNLIKRISKNQITDHYRKMKSSKVDLFSSFDFVKTNEEFYDYELEEKVLLIKKLSNNLSEKCKIVFDMFAIEGYMHKEISDKLNINFSTSKTNFFKAKNKIKKQFDLEYFKN